MKKRIRIEANITQRCNARCWGCNKAVGYADGLFPDITLDDMRRAVDLLLEQRIKVERFTFCGGEPCLHTELQEMIYEVDRLPTLKYGRVLTNDLPKTKARRDAIELPLRFKWVPGPLDNPDDPYSGKNDRKKRKWIHLPFWISPADIGMESVIENCSVRQHCGKGLDAAGFSICGKATMLARLLGELEPATWEGKIRTHVEQPLPDICKHCQYGLSRADQYAIAKRNKDGELPDVSLTFEKAFAEYNADKPLVQLGEV